jgi:hypothetical protein
MTRFLPFTCAVFIPTLSVVPVCPATGLYVSIGVFLGDNTDLSVNNEDRGRGVKV